MWPWTTLFYPSQALAYAGTAYMAAAWYQMGTTPTIGNLTFEVFGNLAGTGANGIDADPALVIYDFLTNPRYGAGFDPAVDRHRRPCSVRAATAVCRPIARRSASRSRRCSRRRRRPPRSSPAGCKSAIARRCGAGGKLKFIPYGDTAIVEGDQQTSPATSPSPMSSRPTAAATNCALPAEITVSSPDEFVSDGGVVYSDSGIPLIFIGIDRDHADRLHHLPPAPTAMNPLGHLRLLRLRTPASRSR